MEWCSRTKPLVAGGFYSRAARLVNGKKQSPMSSSRRIWLDVTTSTRSGSVHDGTTRVERGLIRELPALLQDRLGFCIYNRSMKRFSTVQAPAPPEVHRAAKPQRGKKGVLRAIGRRSEQLVRRHVKGALRHGLQRLDRIRGHDIFPDASAGDIILLAGENWSRYDFDVLRRLRADSGIRIAAVLQDMIPSVHPQFFENDAFIRRFDAYVEFLARDIDLVLAISDSTKDDFLKAVPKDIETPCPVARIELGSDFTQSENRTRPEALTLSPDRPFVLSVSTIQARKNFDLLYRLWQKFGLDGRTDQPHLVIVGKPGFGSSDLLRMMADDPWIADTVTLLHGPSDAELGWLYQHCLFTLYPSWYEGWGLPLSESLAYGKTFIASDASSLPEAGQGLGIHLNPYDPAAWEREILGLAGDRQRLAAMERRIIAERRLASWADCARDTVSALDQIAGAGQ